MIVVLPEIIYTGDDIINFTASVGSSAVGSVTFFFHGANHTMDLVNGVASWSYKNASSLLAGYYNVTVAYNGSESFYGQRNSTSFSVRVRSNPVVYINPIVGTVIKGSSVNITAQTNFDGLTQAQSQLQLVVLLGMIF